jgi:hypothetical protein
VAILRVRRHVLGVPKHGLRDAVGMSTKRGMDSGAAAKAQW